MQDPKHPKDKRFNLYRVRKEFAEGRIEKRSQETAIDTKAEVEGAEAGNALLGLERTFADGLPPDQPIGGAKGLKNWDADDDDDGDESMVTPKGKKKAKRGKKAAADAAAEQAQTNADP